MSERHDIAPLIRPIIVLLVWSEAGLARVEPTTGDTAAVFDIREACETVNDAEHASELFEHLSWLLEHPLDLNRVGEDDLLRIPGVSSHDVALLLRLRSRAGGFSDIEKLLRHRTDGVRLYRALAPFVYAERREGMNAHLRSRVGWRPARDLPDTSTGAPGFREYHRFDVSIHGVLDGGLTMVRDAGERYGDAFFSGCLALSFDRGMVERVIAGDFTVGCAHGLVFGQGMGMGGGMPGSGVRSGGLKMEPFHGSSGTRLLRGVGCARALRFRTGVLSVAGFAARTPFTASLDADGKIRSFDIAYDFSNPAVGSHRNEVREWAAGGRVAWGSVSGVSCGGSLFWRRMSHPFPDGSAFARVANMLVVGIDASVVAGATEFSVEGAWMKEGLGFSGRMGITTGADFRIALNGWHFTAGFHPEKGGTGPLGGETTNETGASIGWDAGLWQKATCSGSFSLFRRPWRTYFDRMPSSGSEAQISLVVPFSGGLTLSGRLAARAGESWEEESSLSHLPDASMARAFRRTLRVTLAYRITRDVRLRTRVEHVVASAFDPARLEHGWLISQEVHAGLTGDLSVDLRCTSVQTDSYVSRVYSLEHDVEGSYAGTSCYGTGVRWYLFLRYVITPGMILSGKYGSAVRTSGPFTSAVDHTLTVQLDVATGSAGRTR